MRLTQTQSCGSSSWSTRGRRCAKQRSRGRLATRPFSPQCGMASSATPSGAGTSQPRHPSRSSSPSSTSVTTPIVPCPARRREILRHSRYPRHLQSPMIQPLLRHRCRLNPPQHQQRKRRRRMARPRASRDSGRTSCTPGGSPRSSRMERSTGTKAQRPRSPPRAGANSPRCGRDAPSTRTWKMAGWSGTMAMFGSATRT
mmetsp:Transcript_124863/g.353414  ORF Transcript_124863/g.353414 Transcript_124863/m.353414 type:complete len:200 (-) Transcript_124863:492-1091(-)